MMDANGGKNDILAHQVQDLSITNDQNMPMKPEGIDGRGVSSETARELNDSNVNGSHPLKDGNKATTPPSHGFSECNTTSNEASTADHTTNGIKEGKTDGIPDIHINGEPEEDHVNMDIMGPEDEDDGDVRTLAAHDSASVGQKSKKKKKSKSKRGLVMHLTLCQGSWAIDFAEECPYWI